MKSKETKPRKTQSTKAISYLGAPYTPPRTTGWLLAVPTSLIGKVTSFTPSDWVVTPQAIGWGDRRAWSWDLADGRSDRTATVHTMTGQPPFGRVADRNGVDWVVRDMPRSRQWPEQWALFYRETGCGGGVQCPEAVREAALRDLIDIHRPALCPMALLEPGTWRRVAQFTR